MNSFRKAKGRENPFVMIPNEMLEDTRLSWKAKGLLAYLLSKPDGWKVWEADLMAHAKDARDSVRSAVQELIKTGYVTRERKQREDGRFAGYDYAVHDKAVSPAPVLSVLLSSGLSVAGKSDTVKTHVRSRFGEQSRSLEVYKGEVAREKRRKVGA